MGVLRGVTGVVCAIVLVSALGHGELGIEAGSEVEAAQARGTFSVTCIVPDSVAYVPEIRYAVLPAPSPSHPSTCQGRLSAVVNGQGDLSPECRWGNDLSLGIHHATAVMKLAGQQRQETTGAELWARQGRQNNTTT